MLSGSLAENMSCQSVFGAHVRPARRRIGPKVIQRGDMRRRLTKRDLRALDQNEHGAKSSVYRHIRENYAELIGRKVGMRGGPSWETFAQMLTRCGQTNGHGQPPHGGHGPEALQARESGYGSSSGRGSNLSCVSTPPLAPAPRLAAAARRRAAAGTSPGPHSLRTRGGVAVTSAAAVIGATCIRRDGKEDDHRRSAAGGEGEV
jgi:hypothetical protein